MPSYNPVIERATLEVFEELGLPKPIESERGVKKIFTFGNGLKVELSRGVKNPQEDYQRIHISHFFASNCNKRMEILRTLSYNSFKDRLKEKLKPLFKQQTGE